MNARDGYRENEGRMDYVDQGHIDISYSGVGAPPGWHPGSYRGQHPSEEHVGYSSQRVVTSQPNVTSHTGMYHQGDYPQVGQYPVMIDMSVVTAQPRQSQPEMTSSDADNINWLPAASDSLGIAPEHRLLHLVSDLDHVVLVRENKPYDEDNTVYRTNKTHVKTVQLFRYRVETRGGEVLYTGVTDTTFDSRPLVRLYDRYHCEVLTVETSDSVCQGLRVIFSVMLCCCCSFSTKSPCVRMDLDIASTLKVGTLTHTGHCCFPTFTVKDAVGDDLLFVDYPHDTVYGPDRKAEIGTLKKTWKRGDVYRYYEITFPKDLCINGKAAAITSCIAASAFDQALCVC